MRVAAREDLANGFFVALFERKASSKAKKKRNREGARVEVRQVEVERDGDVTVSEGV